MIHVRDLEAAIAFYRRALGCTVADRHRYEQTDLVYLSLPGARFELELLSPAHWPYGDAPEPGRSHLAFTVDDLDAEHARLTGLGIPADPIADYVANGRHQTRYFYFCDPEGNQIEFLETSGRYDQGSQHDADTISDDRGDRVHRRRDR